MSKYNREAWKARKARRIAAMSTEAREAARIAYNRRARTYRQLPHVKGKDAKRFNAWKATKDAAYWLWRQASRRARERKLPFTVTVDDVHAVFGKHCPIFATPWGSGLLGPSLDRFIPSRGYVPGNIVVISCRANTMKLDATVEEVERLVHWMRGAAR